MARKLSTESRKREFMMHKATDLLLELKHVGV